MQCADSSARALLLLTCRGPEMASRDYPASYRETFVHSVVGIFRTTFEGHYLEVNPAIAHIYGYESPEELMEALQDLNTQLYVRSGRRQEFLRLMQQQGFVEDF